MGGEQKPQHDDVRGAFASFLRRGVLPGLAPLCIAAATSMAGLQHFSMVRLLLFLLAFVIIRDGLTPVGLWAIGGCSDDGRPFFWLRLPSSALLLWFMAASSWTVVESMAWIDPQLSAGVVLWTPDSSRLVGLGIGLAGAVVVATPVFLGNLLFGASPPAAARLFPRRSVGQLLALAAMCLLGNYWEETLYRGFVVHVAQAKLLLPPWQAVAFSAAAFGLSHLSLAFVVTDAGWGVVVFTVWEAVVAGLVGVCGVATCSRGMCLVAASNTRCCAVIVRSASGVSSLRR